MKPQSHGTESTVQQSLSDSAVLGQESIHNHVASPSHPTAWVAYLAFAGFCVLAAVRDVFSEEIFKRVQAPMDPLATLFIYSLVTVLSSVAYVQIIGGRPFRIFLSVWNRPQVRRDAFAGSLFTGISFLAYFFAIQSELGAGMGAFADFAITPLVAALFAAHLLGEDLRSSFIVAVVTCCVGLGLFLSNRVDLKINMGPHGDAWFGVLMTLMSAVFGSAYRVYTKKLLSHRLDRAMIMAIRFLLSIPALGIVLLFRSNPTHWETAPLVAALAPIIFALPMYLATFALQRMSVNRYSLLMFALPVVTYSVWSVWNHSPTYGTDLIGALVILGGVLYFDFANRSRP